MTSFSSGFIKIIRDEIEVLYKVDKGSIIISAELDVEEKQLGRLNYTMAHELGHNIYHRKMYDKHNYSNQPSFFDEESKEAFAITCHRDNVENLSRTVEKNWIEWQANYFASCILMPKEAVSAFWKDFIKESDFVFGAEPEPLLHDMPYNELKNEFERFVNIFQVSKQAAKIRLEKLNYIKRGQIL